MLAPECILRGLFQQASDLAARREIRRFFFGEFMIVQDGSGIWRGFGP